MLFWLPVAEGQATEKDLLCRESRESLFHKGSSG